MDHDCVMKSDVKEMTEGVKSLTIDVALMKADVVDLKAATILMSGCVRTLTESLLVSQQNTITREKFYEAMKNQECVISEKIESISSRLSVHETAISKYPTPLEVDEADKVLQTHSMYFKIIWVLAGLSWVLLLFILDRLWVK